MNEKELKKLLAIKRKIVKNKLQLLKHGEIIKENIFSPITRRLENIQSELKQNINKNVSQDSISNKMLKTDEFTNTNFNNSDKIYNESVYNDNKSENFKATDISGIKRSILENVGEEDEEINKVNRNGDRFKDIADDSFIEYLDQYDPLPRKYIQDMYTYSGESDQQYGVRHDADVEKFYIGDSELFIDGSDVVVKNKKYKGTRGLYELLFKKRPNPEIFTDTDQKNYQKIVFKTNANRRYYQPNKQIQGSRLDKYKNIIAPIAQGEGIYMEENNNKISYVHWDDPNELVDRLRLLLASTSAGHTGHNNEINSLEKELRDAKRIY